MPSSGRRRWCNRGSAFGPYRRVFWNGQDKIFSAETHLGLAMSTLGQKLTSKHKSTSTCIGNLVVAR